MGLSHLLTLITVPVNAASSTSLDMRKLVCCDEALELESLTEVEIRFLAVLVVKADILYDLVGMLKPSITD